MTLSILPKDVCTASNTVSTTAATAAAAVAASGRQQRGGDDAAVDGVEPLLASLSESERLALAVRFGRIRMCAALTHGHSFETSIFRLPAKCSGCHELVWGPFTRGCTCLVCKLTAHRSCTGMASIPQCPTKALFADFCRSELRPATVAPSSDGESIAVVTPVRGNASTSTRSGGGDLDEWATVEGTTDQSSCGGVVDRRSFVSPPAAASQAVQDLGSSFSWSPLGGGYRKLATENKDQPPPPPQQQQQQEPSMSTTAAAAAAAAAAVTPEGDGEVVSAEVALAEQVDSATAPDPAAATGTTTADAGAGASANNSKAKIRNVGKMSVAGGVVGAVLGGPVGAVVGLKVGAFLGAGRWSVQELWQRIEKDRQEAGAEGIRLLKGSEGAVAAAAAAEEALARRHRDVWARIAEKVKGEKKPLVWDLDAEQRRLLDQGECDAGEVAMFVVGKVLADESAMPSHLYAALLSEFRSRHRLCDCRRPIKRRSSDSDMVALFPRAGGSRQAADLSAPSDGASYFASTPGLEKTFSFVEETEIVEGEESDTAGFGEDGDGDSGSEHGSGGRDGAAPGTRVDRPFRAAWAASAASSSTPTSPETAVRPASGRRVSALASKDVWRNGSSRMDSWVELEGVGCSSCGGRVSSGGKQGPSLGLLGKDVDEDEGGFGEGWAAAEVPPCWCADEGGLSASPESVQSLAPALRRDAAGRVNESAQTPGRDGRTEPGLKSRVEEMIPELDDPIDLVSVATGEPSPVGGISAPDAQEWVDGAEPGKEPKGCGAGTRAAGGTAGDDGRADEEACDALRDVHGVLRELTQALLTWCPLLTASDEAAIQAVNCIDQRVFSETYGPVYGRIASGQARDRDATLARRVEREERSRMAFCRPSLVAECWPEVLAALRAAGAARTGRDKLGFLVQAVERISEALPAKASTDTLLWSLCRHLSAATISVGAAGGRLGGSSAPMPRPHAEVAFVEQFVRDESWLMGKQGYVLTTVDAALHVLIDPAMSDEIFLDTPESSEQATGGDGQEKSARGRDDA